MRYRQLIKIIIFSLGCLCAYNLQAQNKAVKEYIFSIYDAPPWYFKDRDNQPAGMMSFFFKIIDKDLPEHIGTLPVPYQRALAWLSGSTSNIPNVDFIVSLTSPVISTDFTKCASLGSFSVIAFSMAPLEKIIAANKTKKTHIGVLRGTTSLIKSLLPKEIYSNWDITELNSEEQMYNLVRKGRLDAALMTLNVYQYLIDNLENAVLGYTTSLGYLEVYAWLPRHYSASKGHRQLCAKLNKYSSNGSMQLDTDEMIETLMYQQEPDLSMVPRISKAQKDQVVDAAFKKLYPQLYEQSKAAQTGAKP